MDIYKTELEQLKQTAAVQSEAHARAARENRDMLEKLKLEEETKIRTQQVEITDLKGLLESKDAHVKDMLETSNKSKWELEKKCQALLEAIEVANKQLQVAERDWQLKFEQDKFNLRQVYEKKIEKLQKKVVELRNESQTVRKMIVGAAADLYNSYATDVKHEGVQQDAKLRAASQWANASNPNSGADRAARLGLSPATLAAYERNQQLEFQHQLQMQSMHNLNNNLHSNGKP